MRNETSAFYFRQAELDALANGASLLNKEQRQTTIDYLQSFIINDLFKCEKPEETLSLAWHCFATLKSLDGIEKYEKALFNTLNKAPNIQHMDLQNLEAYSACWSLLKNYTPDKFLAADIADHLLQIRCPDSSWSHIKRSPHSSLYGSWLAFSTYQNIEKAIPEELKVLNLLNKIKAKDDAFGHQYEAEHGSIASTYFAICLLKSIEEDIPHQLNNWICEQQADDGGFLATHIMPFGDINSTAHALLSLKNLDKPFDSVKNDTLNFIHDHYQNTGGFIAHCRELKADPASSYYGLVALGIVDSYLKL
ncbi:hypothetical protein PQO01_04670 [Lentisphaera marina]|uniref:prenyltransferase/squalene oxidase repeat-containing protein n=1 Tax=Lentisphaera marina TaxID=1111041 RepID=UPI002365A7A0|nr:hypothetical protein [Lentisphaera marina]MDD7984238.1 hypothetical protein [Lentisphaera marina]